MLLDDIINSTTITKALVINTFRKELVKVKVILNQKSDVTCLELQCFVSEYFGVWKNVEVERT